MLNLKFTQLKKRSHLLFLLLIPLLWGCQPEDQRALVVSKLRAASDLSTAQFILNKIVIGKVGKTNLLRKAFNRDPKEESFMIYTEATVKTGIDLDQLKEEDLLIEGTRITLKLPPVQVQNFNFPPDRFKLDKHYSDPGEVDKMSPKDIDVILQMAESDIRSRINNLGLLRFTFHSIPRVP